MNVEGVIALKGASSAGSERRRRLYAVEAVRISQQAPLPAEPGKADR